MWKREREFALTFDRWNNQSTNSEQIHIKSVRFADSDGTLMLPRITRGHFSDFSEVDHQHALA
jgi:hypothetical protein